MKDLCKQIKHSSDQSKDDKKGYQVETSLTPAVISGWILRPRVPPHRRHSFLQRANATSDEVLHHMPPGESILLQVFDGLNIRSNSVEFLGNIIPGRNLFGSIPHEGKAVFLGGFPVKPPLPPSRPRRPGKHLNILPRLQVVELQTTASGTPACRAIP